MKSNQVAKLSQLFITKQITWLSFSTEENPVKVSIFDKEYFLNWVSIETVWDKHSYVPESYIKVSYVSILKSGKAGEDTTQGNSASKILESTLRAKKIYSSQSSSNTNKLFKASSKKRRWHKWGGM
jgi:hypothetical protein